MNRRLERMVHALGPVMTPMAAEVCLRGTAICRRKPVELLTAEDLPAIEAAVRDALEPCASAASIELTIHSIRELFLAQVESADC